MSVLDLDWIAKPINGLQAITTAAMYGAADVPAEYQMSIRVLCLK
jgi:hypothetical protein